MRFGSAAKVLAECKLKYYRISECVACKMCWCTAHLEVNTAVMFEHEHFVVYVA